MERFDSGWAGQISVTGPDLALQFGIESVSRQGLSYAGIGFPATSVALLRVVQVPHEVKR